MTSYGLAIDYGTSFTCAAMVVDGELESVEVEGRREFPSAVFVGDEGLVVGPAALRQARARPERFEHAPKRLLGGRAVVLGREVEPEALVAEVLSRVLEAAKTRQGRTAPAWVRLTHPARWYGERLSALRRAAERAGLGDVELLSEPEAAAWYFVHDRRGEEPLVELGQCVAIYDLGGGTFDTAVLRRVGADAFELEGKGGDPDLGGDKFDQHLADYLLERLAKRHREIVGGLAHPSGPAWRRVRHQFDDDVRELKEELSDEKSAQRSIVPPEGADEVPVDATQEAFFRLIRRDLAHSVQTLEATVRKAGLNRDDVAAVYLTGGSSRIPLVFELVTAFHPHTFQRPNPKTLVAHGALAKPQIGSGSASLNWASSAGALVDWSAGVQEVTLILSGAGDGVAFSPDGRYLAAADADTAGVWEVPGGEESVRVEHDGIVYGVAFSPDGRSLAVGDQDATAIVWGLPGGRLSVQVSHDAEVYGVAFSPDGRLLATASDDGTARVWELPSGQEFVRIVHDDEVAGVAFSPDGQFLATASADGTARVWELPGGQEFVRIEHDDMVAGVAFSPDGQFLATASADGTARVWELPGGLEAVRLGHEKVVYGVAFSPDGRSLATASEDGMARVWTLPGGQESVRIEHDDEVRGSYLALTGGISRPRRRKLARVWESAANSKRINRSRPTIQGSPRVGETLVASEGKWAPETDDVVVQWLRGPAGGDASENERDWDAIQNATDTRYTLNDDDEGRQICLRATGSVGARKQTVLSPPVRRPVLAADARIAGGLFQTRGETADSVLSPPVEPVETPGEPFDSDGLLAFLGRGVLIVGGFSLLGVLVRAVGC